MATPRQRDQVARPLTHTGPGYELEFAPALLSKRAPSSGLFARLAAIGERSGTAIGDAYAVVAGHVLVGVEWLEDLAATRSTRRSSTSRTTREVPRLAPRAGKALPPSK